MDERKLEVFRFTDDPDVSTSIETQCAGTKITAGQEARIDERATARIEFGKPSVVDERRQGADTRVRRYGVGRIWTEAGEDRLTGAIHGNGYALKAQTNECRVAQARSVRGHFGDEGRGIRKLSRDGGLKYAWSNRPECAGVAVDVSIAAGIKSDGCRADRTSASVLWCSIADNGAVT